jgi:hypothetical protein
VAEVRPPEDEVDVESSARDVTVSLFSRSTAPGGNRSVTMR